MRQRILGSPAFAGAVALLLVNDWLLKPAFGNWMTGKLSDVAGVAALAMLLAALMPRRRAVAFGAAAVTFALWKSPLSEPLIAAWNALGLWPVARVVDWSDLLASGVLVPTFWLVGRIERAPATERVSAMTRARAVATGLVAVFAFAATSVLQPTPVSWAAYTLPGSRGATLAALDSLHIPLSSHKDHPGPGGADTLTVAMRYPPENWLELKVSIGELATDQSELRVIQLEPGARQFNEYNVRTAFEAQVIQPLQGWLARHPGGTR